MKEPYKNRIIITILNSIYDVLIVASCLVLWSMSIWASVQYGTYSKQALLIFFPTVILIFHTISAKVLRKDMFEKEIIK